MLKASIGIRSRGVSSHGGLTRVVPWKKRTHVLIVDTKGVCYDADGLTGERGNGHRAK